MRSSWLALALLLVSCATTSDTRSIPLRVPLRSHPETGFPSPNGIVGALNTPFASLLRCYDLAGGKTYGITEIWFAIQPDGSVSDIEVRPTTTSSWLDRDGTGDPNAGRNPAVDRCLVELVAAKRFPEPDAVTPVDVHATFHREPGMTMALMRSYALCR